LIGVKAERSESGSIFCVNEKPLIDPAREKILALADETQFAANGIVSRTLFRTPTTRMVLFGFAEGQELSEHTSTSQAIIQVLSGACEFSLDGKPHHLKAGNLLYMPPNLPHAVKAIEPFSMLLTLIKPAPEAAPATPSLPRI
jgi:quercetin dioxygenase-like cupin family protein